MASSASPWPSAPAAPLVSVIIPAHNAGLYIEESITSVLAQQVADLEVIVVDDASTDNTAEVVGDLRDHRVQLVRTAKVGAGAARNRGLELARGRFIGFQDADDRWRPGKLKRQLALLQGEPDVGFVFTNVQRFDVQGYHNETQFDYIAEFARVGTRPATAGDGKVITDDTFIALAAMSHFPCYTQSMLARAEVIRGLTFPSDMRLAEDFVFVLNVYRRGRGAFLEDPLVDIRRHANNSYNRGDSFFLPDIDALTRVLVTVSSPPHRFVLRRRIGLCWMKAGYHYLWTGQIRAAAKAYAHALAVPGVRGAALVRLAASPLAPILVPWAPKNLSGPFPSGRP
jgi:glycosyltransferase involved in cell wall biosynthesis